MDDEEPATPPTAKKGSSLKSSIKKGIAVLQRSGSVLLEHHGPAQVYKPPVIRTRFEAEVPPPVVAGTAMGSPPTL